VREAQSLDVVARAGALPNVSVALQTSPIARLPGETISSSFLAAGLLSWEIDLWGRIRRGTEAAQADLVGREAARDDARVSLIAQAASGHFGLAALRETQTATLRSVELQRASLQLMRRRNAAGIVSAAEVRQAEGQLAGTDALRPEVARQIYAAENALALLLARPPAAFAPTPATLDLPPALPTGLPADLLERRPDLRQAEQQLIAWRPSQALQNVASWPSGLKLGPPEREIGHDRGALGCRRARLARAVSPTMRIAVGIQALGSGHAVLQWPPAEQPGTAFHP
jgi:multidrug efflux system outer membrane protein